MPLANTVESWGLVSRVLHWATAAVILFQLIVGTVMVGVDDLAQRFAMTQTHKSWGFVVFVLALARLGWRLAQPAVPAEPGRGWERAAARAGHVALYVLMVALPLSGWLMASASPLQEMYGVRNMVFGLFDLPDPFVPGDRALEDALKLVHRLAGNLLALLLLVHAAAALRHHFVLRDDVLRRMTWGR